MDNQFWLTDAATGEPASAKFDTPQALEQHAKTLPNPEGFQVADNATAGLYCPLATFLHIMKVDGESLPPNVNLYFFEDIPNVETNPISTGGETPDVHIRRR